MNDVVQKIIDLYDTEDGCCGGYGHVVFDDGNLETETIKWCLKEAKNNSYKENYNEDTRQKSIIALEAMLRLNQMQRQDVYDLLWPKL